MMEYNVTEEMAENRSMWHMKIKAGPLLHAGGIYVRKVRKKIASNSRQWPTYFSVAGNLMNLSPQRN